MTRFPAPSVSLYGANSAMVGSDETGEDGYVSIKVARAMTSGNMVMAGVSDDDYDVADEHDRGILGPADV